MRARLARASSAAKHMGLLKVGKPLSWDEAAPHRDYVRRHGVEQFLATLQRVEGPASDVLKWGGEIEYGVLALDAAGRVARLAAPRGAEVLRALIAHEDAHRKDETSCAWVPEYGSWMLEGTPRAPYGGYVTDLLGVEANMRLRRARVCAMLGEGEIAPTLTAFPRMGCADALPPPPPARRPTTPRAASCARGTACPTGSSTRTRASAR